MNVGHVTENRPKVKQPFLVETIKRKRREIAERRERRPEAEMRREASRLVPAIPWGSSLCGDRVQVIAEFKRASPSAGNLAVDVDAATRAKLYEQGGAAAVSVLTDSAFRGSETDLIAVREAIEIPILRKDFIVDPYQVWESRVIGADAALVILAAVTDGELDTIIGAAEEAGLGLLFEAHTEEDVSRAVALAPAVVGVNARDLKTLEVSAGRCLEALAELRAALPASTVLVAESGLRHATEVTRARDAGANAVLVGEHLMRAADPGAALRALSVDVT